MGRIIHDLREADPVRDILLECIAGLIKSGQIMAQNYPTHELDILRETTEMIKQNITEFTELKRTTTGNFTKHSYFAAIIKEIEDLSTFGVRADSLATHDGVLSVETLERIWKAIPVDLSVRFIVVRVILEP